VRRAIRVPLAAALIAAPVLLAACGERAHIPNGSAAAPAGTSHDANAANTTTTISTAGTGASALPTLPKGRLPPTTVPAATGGAVGAAATDPTQRAILGAYESYLVDLSGLDDNLSQGYIAPLAAVTTTRLAQASVRQAAAILAAQEHGVGTLHDDHVSVVMTGSSSAVLADCQDDFDFYLVSDSTSTPDAFVQRGDFAGSAQMVLQNGHWLVDVFTTTHVACSY
jgi:autotransporter adhesin